MQSRLVVLCSVALVALSSVAVGDVFNMGDELTSLEMVTVGNPGNAGELSGEGAGGSGPDHICGAVDYVYQIGKYEVTNAQYAEFLNAVAAVGDPNRLYDQMMGTVWPGELDSGGILRSGEGTMADPWVYTARTDRANRPVNFVYEGQSFRFANWLHNKQPTGGQDGSTTEDGAYDMSLGYYGIVRKTGAKVFLPTEDEWYKAAYYDPNLNDGTGEYWDYSTRSNTLPTSEAPPGTDLVNGSANYGAGSLVDTTHYTTEVGAYNAKPSDSAYGTFDQGGNVWEVNETLVDGGIRGFRGGCWAEGGYLLPASFRLDAPPASLGTFGLRVARIPEPGSIILLLSAALALAAYARRRRPTA